MPVDTKVISVLQALQFMNNASWIEKYLIGIAYGVFASPNVAPSYEILDRNVFSYDMPLVVKRLNAELNKLGFNQAVPDCIQMDALIKNLRSILMESEKRANYLDWLVGNDNESFWEEAKKQEVWKMNDEDLGAFCQELHLKAKAAKNIKE